MRIGFVGLGTMGGPMVGHLLAGGHQVAVWARRPEAAADVAAQGATLAASPAEAARGADVFCTNVTAAADVEAVLFGGPDAAIHGLARGALVLDFSTISPQATRDLAARLAQHGVDMLDCPVSGGGKGAREASLAIMAGGSAEAFERARPVLSLLGRTLAHVGGHGAGQVVKACNQIAQVVNIAGIAEAFRFCEAEGVDPQAMLKALQAGMAGSKMLDLMGPKMAARDFAAGIEARLHHKDLVMARDHAAAQGVALPVLEATARQLDALMDAGWGRDDTSSLLRVLER